MYITLTVLQYHSDTMALEMALATLRTCHRHDHTHSYLFLKPG